MRVSLTIVCVSAIFFSPANLVAATEFDVTESFSYDNGLWTENDPDNKIVLDYDVDHRLEFSDWRRYNPGYVVTSCSTQDFLLEYDVYISDHGGNGAVLGPGLTDTLGTNNLTQNGVLSLFYAGFGHAQIDIVTYQNGSIEWSYGGWGDLPNRIWINTGTIYYVRLEKGDDTITLSIFSDVARTAHIAGSPKTVVTNVVETELNYLYAVTGSHADPAGNWEWPSGWIDNVNVSYTTSPVDPCSDDTLHPTGAVHAYDNTIWPPNNKMVSVTLAGYVLDEQSIAGDGGGTGVSSAYLVVDGGTTITLKDETENLLDEQGRFSVETEVLAVKGAEYSIELFATDMAPESAGGPNSGLVDSTHIRVPRKLGR